MRAYPDTNVYVYRLDVYSPFYKDSNDILTALLQPRHRLITSLVVHGELLVYPTRSGDRFTQGRIDHFFGSNRVSLALFDKASLAAFVAVRARGVKPLDALHLAIAAGAGVDLFVTNDHDLQKLTVPGIGRIVGLAEAVGLLS